MTKLTPAQERWDQRCDAHAKMLADLVDANEPERETIAKLSKLVRYGHRVMDVEFRKDGVVHRLQADWLARLFRVSSPLADLTPTGQDYLEEKG